jgi:uncharacterized phage protein gp47/JayE
VTLPYEITDAGPPSFTYPEVRAANVDDWRESFGDDANTAPDVTDGQIIDLFSLPQLLAYQAASRQWADSFIRTARESALDGLLDAFGLTRDPARATVAQVVWFGDELTPVPLGSRVQTTGSALVFETTATGSTGADLGSDTWMLRVPSEIIVAATYTADIDGTPYTHAAGAETSADVAEALEALINAGADGTAQTAGVDSAGRALLIIDVTGGPGIVSGASVGGTAPESFPAVRLDVQATTTGPSPAPVGTIQSVPTPIAGIVGASNGVDATPGRDIESDDEFRARHFDRLGGQGCGTDQAIRADVLDAFDAQGIEFVETCDVRSNRTSVVDAAGRDPHSFETIIRYTDTAPADANTRVAAAIASCMPAGIKPYGQSFTESVEVYPGNFVDVSASLVQTLYLHLDITVTPGENFPEAGDQEEAIAQAVAAAWELIAKEAQDWYRTGSVAAVSDAVSGTALDIAIESDITTLPTDVPTFSSVAFEAAGDREIIDLDSGRVSVTIV